AAPAGRGLGSPAPCGRIPGRRRHAAGESEPPTAAPRPQGQAVVNHTLLATSAREAAAALLRLAQRPGLTTKSLKLVPFARRTDAPKVLMTSCMASPRSELSREYAGPPRASAMCVARSRDPGRRGRRIAPAG